VALVYALGLLVLGSVVLGQVSWTAAVVGLSAAVVYNGVYTPLKRVTPFAALPGSLIGALPPVVGWVAAGGYLSDPTIHMVAFFFFLWQIPHFWLLLLYYEQDYQDGGMPSLFDRFDRRQIARLTFLWIAAVCVAALLLPMVKVFDRSWPAYLVAAAGLGVVLRALALLRVDAEARAVFARTCRIRFMEINTFALLVSVALVVDGLV
jgi:protoheme IX farnesyltransferase